MPQKIGEEIAVLKNEVFNMNKAAEEAKDQNTLEHTEIKKIINDFIKSADKKYAPIWIQWAIQVIIGVIITGFIGLVYSLVN